MSLGLPNFNFIFQSKGVSAIERSARGIVAVILKDDTEGEEQNVYNKVDDVDFTQWTEDNYNYLKLIYEGAPSKVIAMSGHQCRKLQCGSEEVKGLKMELSVHPWN